MGFDINWSPPANATFKDNQFYIKYNTLTLEAINLNMLRTDLGGIIPTAESANIMAYLSGLNRLKILLAV